MLLTTDGKLDWDAFAVSIFLLHCTLEKEPWLTLPLTLASPSKRKLWVVSCAEKGKVTKSTYTPIKMWVDLGLHHDAWNLPENRLASFAQ